MILTASLPASRQIDRNGLPSMRMDQVPILGAIAPVAPARMITGSCCRCPDQCGYFLLQSGGREGSLAHPAGHADGARSLLSKSDSLDGAGPQAFRAPDFLGQRAAQSGFDRL